MRSRAGIALVNAIFENGYDGIGVNDIAHAFISGYGV